tara:strand:- start:35 stop:793 length:759 start_codon:yes stop_codon:yes gene_type:complete
VSQKSSQQLPDNFHVAIIMDGNGRWAKSKGLPRTAGHKKGVEATRSAVESAIELNVKYLTLFGFSSENWARPEDEVSELMKLLRYYLKSETVELHKNGICLKVIGLRDNLDDDILAMIDNAQELTKDNDRLFLTIALNYGGRQEIIKAVENYTNACVEHGETRGFHEVMEEFPNHLMTANTPDPDILIRTSGEYRISNFLLWQCAYSEFVFQDVLWPDFAKKHFMDALESYQKRERRFGGLKSAARKAQKSR